MGQLSAKRSHRPIRAFQHSPQQYCDLCWRGRRRWREETACRIQMVFDCNPIRFTGSSKSSSAANAFKVLRWSTIMIANISAIDRQVVVASTFVSIFYESRGARPHPDITSSRGREGAKSSIDRPPTIFKFYRASQLISTER